MKARTSKLSNAVRGRRQPAAKDLTAPKTGDVGDLKTRASRAAEVKGGAFNGFMPQARADKPGETQGVIAIIKPGGGTR